MSEDGRRRGLGRGLSALLGEDAKKASEPLRASRTLPVELLHPGRYQPRRTFDQASLDSLVESVRAQGILQPLLVRRHPEIAEAYEIIAGERRWRAAQLARLHEVPVVVRELGDREALEIALVENVQRQDLSPLEEAEGYRRLMDEFKHTQDDLARAVGKSRSHVANTLRLLSLPETVRRMVEDGRLSAGHARALLNAANAAELAEDIVRRGLNVRQTEQLARGAKDRAAKKPTVAAWKDADTAALERTITMQLGLKVTIDARGESGALTIHYRSLEQLDDVVYRLGIAIGDDR